MFRVVFRLFLLLGAAMALGFNNCAPNQMAGYRQSGIFASMAKKAASYDDIVGEYGSVPPVQDPIEYEVRRISVKSEPVDRCVLGELDIVQAAFKCGSTAVPLVATVKDNAREQKILKFEFGYGWTWADLMTKLTTAVQANVTGTSVDLFICFDSDNDGQCADEQIIDLNTLSAKLAAGQSLCATIAQGFVLYHKHHKLAGGPVTTVAIKDMAADVVQDVLKNLDDTTEPVEVDGRTDFVIPLVKSNPDLCPKPQVRTDGCFAKGTRIAVAKDVTLPIEKLHGGDRVLLADGRTSVIKRVIAGPESKPMVAFETEGGHKLMVTSEHPMVTKAGLKLAQDVTIGDELKTAKGTFEAISSLSRKSFKEHVYNFELEGAAEADHLVVAEGLVSGELFLQNKMTKKPPVKSLARK